VRTRVPIAGESLAGVAMFSVLDLESRQSIADMCCGMECAPGEIVVSRNDATRDVYFVLNGTIEVCVFSSTGRQVSFNDKFAGEIVGELSAVDGKPRSADVKAKTSCLIASIGAPEFQHILASYPSLAQHFYQHLVSQVRLLSERVFEFNALCVNSRIHVELLRQALAAPSVNGRREISPAPTHAEIASRVSTHREAVSREISRLTKAGLVKKSGEALVVVDPEQLKELVSNALGEPPIFC
jgi:CRP/FNR family cyclic AMP-dependent transcriptional regulator